jgi:hypothetical protein
MELAYDNLEVGQTFPPARFVADPARIRGYLEATDDDGPHPGAPNTFGHLFAVPRAVLPDATIPPGGVHARQAYEFFRPLRPGEQVTTTMRVVEKYEKKGRRYVVYEFEVRGSEGDRCLVSRMTAVPGR